MEDEKKEKGGTKEEWLHMIRIGTTVFVTFVLCILFFFILLRFQGFASGWKKVINAMQPIIIGLVLAYILNPVMLFLQKKNCISSGMILSFPQDTQKRVRDMIFIVLLTLR